MITECSSHCRLFTHPHPNGSTAGIAQVYWCLNHRSRGSILLTTSSVVRRTLTVQPHHAHSHHAHWCCHCSSSFIKTLTEPSMVILILKVTQYCFPGFPCAGIGYLRLTTRLWSAGTIPDFGNSTVKWVSFFQNWALSGTVPSRLHSTVLQSINLVGNMLSGVL